MGIPVEDQTAPKKSEPESRGKLLIRSLIGSDPLVMEIFVPEKHPFVGASNGASYFINGVRVAPDVYRDVLSTADKDRWCRNCNGIHIYGHEEEEDGFIPLGGTTSEPEPEGEPS